MSKIKMFYYQGYGLTMRANKPLADLTPISMKSFVDLEIYLVDERQSLESILLLSSCKINFTIPPLAPGKEIQIQRKAEGIYYQIAFPDGQTINAAIAANGKQIFVTWKNFLLEEVTAALLGPLMGCALRLRELLCLHASVIAVENRVIIILGNKGAGKSTTAAALAKKGFPILSDDIAVLDDGAGTFLVQPGYPRLRLWPDAVNAFYGSEINLPRVRRDMEKRYVVLSPSSSSAKTWRFQNEPLPLAAIYVLEQRQPGLAAPAIEPISPSIGLIALRANLYPEFLILERNEQAREFALLARLANTVPILKVHRPDDLNKVTEVCDTVLKNVQSIPNL